MLPVVPYYPGSFVKCCALAQHQRGVNETTAVFFSDKMWIPPASSPGCRPHRVGLSPLIPRGPLRILGGARKHPPPRAEAPWGREATASWTWLPSSCPPSDWHQRSPPSLGRGWFQKKTNTTEAVFVLGGGAAPWFRVPCSDASPTPPTSIPPARPLGGAVASGVRPGRIGAGRPDGEHRRPSQRGLHHQPVPRARGGAGR